MFSKFKFSLLTALFLISAVITFAQEESSVQEPSAKEPLAVTESTNRSSLFGGGVSLGSSFASPWVIVTLHGIYTPFTHVFVQLGLDIGVVKRQ